MIRIKAINPEVRFVFTAELQGCSIYVRYIQSTKEIEFYHYNRPTLEHICINKYQDNKIVENGNNYISDSGHNIPEIPDGAILVDKDNNRIEPKNGVIIIDKKLYYRINEETPIEIKQLSLKPIEDIIKQNMEFIETEKILDEKYSRVFKSEEYLKLPFNFPLLVDFGKIPPASYSTPLIYCDDNNKWHFISQKINYNNKDSHKIKALIPENLDNDAFLEVALDSVNEHIPNLRSKKSLTEEFGKEMHIERNLTECLFSNITYPVEQSHSSHKEEGESIEFSSKNVEDMISSSGSRVQFWPLNLVKRVEGIVLSCLPTSWVSTTNEINGKSLKKESNTESLLKQKAPVEINATDSTILEMGDQFINNIDLNGNLMWGILFARKWYGCQSTLKRQNSEIRIDYDTWAASLVDQYAKTLLKHALACGIRPVVYNIVKASALDIKMIKIVRQKLETRKINDIPQLLFEKMIRQHTSQIESSTTQKQTKRLLVSIGNDIPNIKQKFLQQEKEFMLGKPCFATTQLILNNKQAFNNIMKQQKSGIQSQQSQVYLS